ncbi:hypothetical protein [Spirochaeta thermophila]|uniref:Phospholipase C/D domain-containing protein n=1 Tax=Winmispira thermophila (strain ATCC 49972 / DSM 6192 / RI 19.B1) TaxID=665571 RepID=E0RT57_WINT6|nr:hypothetical protein [Spirochaeta thermophila]ADN02353.1 hypothetical protein STHERM_c14130 [Spirochaeta thermophila DSM 6192]
MPSHITHALVAWKAWALATGRSVPREGPLPSELRALTFGAQGPDIFFHNRRRKPSGLSLGALAHRRAYGPLTSAMQETLAEDDALGLAYLAGWITHAITDRILHPYVIYRSGWFSPELPHTKRYIRCHTLLERLIDLHLLAGETALEIEELDFRHYVDLGEEAPAWFVRMLKTGFRSTYQEARKDKKLVLRIRNAYADARDFYAAIHPVTHTLVLRRMEERPSREARLKGLTLLHPLLPPSFDIANTRRSLWYEPTPPPTPRREGIAELFQKAVDLSADTIAPLYSPRVSKAPLEAFLRDRTNLSDGRHEGRSHVRYSNPLPLPSYLEDLLLHYEARFPLTAPAAGAGPSRTG